jgi:hypothetical protein
MPKSLRVSVEAPTVKRGSHMLEEQTLARREKLPEGSDNDRGRRKAVTLPKPLVTIEPRSRQGQARLNSHSGTSGQRLDTGCAEGRP